ncbi:RNA-directed DNA polymerase, eukaryota, reverse transcriptase zinc-binding domain protein [Tanacetum coccineum]
MNGTVDYVGETNLASSSVSKENDVTRAEVVNIEENVLESEVENVDKDDSIGEGVNQVMDENNVNETKVEVDKNNNCQEEIDVEEDSDRKGKGDEVCDQSQKSYVDAAGKGVIIFDKTLLNIPTEFDSNGNEIVVFDEVMIVEGSKRWEKTLYAYFVGYSMYVNELKYNLRKMWSRYGFKDIVDYNNGIYFMKFNTDELVKNKPFIVHKWDINMCLDKKEPITIPLRVKICYVPLEAWTTKGISALASRSGKPLVMDAVSASMCKMGVERVGFARVFVVSFANKSLPYEIEVMYKNEAKEEMCRITVKVMYDWKPPCCASCYVIGHSTIQCHKNKVEERVVGSKGSTKVMKNKEGVKNRLVVMGRMIMRVLLKFAFQPKRPVNNNVVPKEGVDKPKEDVVYVENEIRELQEIKNREVVENFINKKKVLTESVKKDWNKDMIAYYKHRKEELIDKGRNVGGGYNNGTEEIDDVFMDDIVWHNVWKKMIWLEWMGQKEVRSFIIDEALSICAVLETHIKSRRLNEVGESIFGNSNMQHCDKRCRIMLGWNNEHEKEYEGFQMFKTVKKLKSLKRDLRKLSWKDGNIFEKVQSLKMQLKEVQTKIDSDPNDKDLRMEESQCIHDYVEAMKDEGKLLFQKAKIKWLKVGDRNNSYFHKVLKRRNYKSRINTVRDIMGNLFQGEDVVVQFVNHFHKFLGTEEPVRDFEPFSHLIMKKLAAVDANFMVREVCDEEIKEAMFQIDGNKAPGPDGFSSLFFKKAWDIVGGNVCGTIKEFFSIKKMLREINSTLISLIPKIQTPDKVTDFRPIASCNELLKGYERKDGPNRVAMKIDIQKAYDTVNWKFLKAILKGFGFHEKMVQWITCCITTVSFSISMNGESFGYFKGGKALRQGNPMSPYLFTLVMEIMSLIVQDKVKRNKDFGYHIGCKHMKLTHVCFADDMLMFCHGDKGFVSTLKEAIDEFGTLSGLKPNYDKSTIIFGSVQMKDKQEILECVPFKVEQLPIKYLGVPPTQKGLELTIARALLTKLKTKSLIGRIVFLLPQTVINDINKILKGFLWNQGELSRGKAKVAWKDICRPKSQGGLGLKDLGV